MPDNLHPTHLEKTLNGMKASHAVKHITFNPSEANPGETLYLRMPKLNDNEVLVPGSLAGMPTTFWSRTSRGRLWTSWS